jgi:hypothetical protein
MRFASAKPILRASLLRYYARCSLNAVARHLFSTTGMPHVLEPVGIHRTAALVPKFTCVHTIGLKSFLLRCQGFGRVGEQCGELRIG